MDFPAPPPVQYSDEPSRSWPRAVIVTAAIAGLELVVLIVIALAFIAKPFADDAASKATAERQQEQAAAIAPRTETPVLVLNGNACRSRRCSGQADAKAQLSGNRNRRRLTA